MKETLVKKAYEVAKERYAEIGIDTEKILEQLQNFHLSMHCWQADDVKAAEDYRPHPEGGSRREPCLLRHVSQALRYYRVGVSRTENGERKTEN